MRRGAALAAVAAVVLAGCTIAGSASADPVAVQCSSDGQTLTCPLPAPETVISTETATVTEVATETATLTQTVVTTVPGGTVAVTQPPVTVTATPAPTTSIPPTTNTPTVTETPTTSTTVQPAAWPGPSNTGVPAGTGLTAYTGSCTISAPATIDGKTITCPNGVLVRAAGVIIRNSKIVGRIIVDTDTNRTWSLTLTDSEVDAGAGDLPAIYNGNVSILRANIHGGHNGLECQEHSSVCSLRDSWIHDQWQAPSGDTHLGGFLALGVAVPCVGVCVELVHNRITCDAPVNSSGGGCTGDINLLPHFGPLPSALIQGNLLGANVGASYCTYGGAGMEHPASNIVYRDNVFQRGTNGKCAAYGPVTNFDSAAPGNVWTGNRWDDGGAVNPEN